MNESKNARKNISMMLTGMVIGAALTGGSIAVAAGITAEPTWQPIFVDGQQVEMEAYNIAGHNYVKLRDIGEQVCFNVYWDSDNGCVQVESGKPYTGTAPQQTAAAPTDGSRYVPKVGDVIRCDDGSDYTIKDVSRWDKNAFSSSHRCCTQCIETRRFCRRPMPPESKSPEGRN